NRAGALLATFVHPQFVLCGPPLGDRLAGQVDHRLDPVEQVWLGWLVGIEEIRAYSGRKTRGTRVAAQHPKGVAARQQTSDHSLPKEPRPAGDRNLHQPILAPWAYPETGHIAQQDASCPAIALQAAGLPS